MTVPKAGSLTAARKFASPLKAPTTPDLDTSLKAILNTMPMGNTTKTAISRRLGRIHR